MSIEQDSLRPVADEMALLLSGEDGAAAVFTMQRLGLLSTLAENTAGASRARSGTVGLWEPTAQGYERSEARRAEWSRWANVPSIPRKGTRKRVLLLGESVARGYFYDPGLTAAQALESSLTAAWGEPVEVVDLAKVDLLIPELISLSDTALALEPDVLVVFAGNNWFTRSERDRCLEAATLRTSGVAGYKKLREQRLSALVENHIRPHFARLSMRQPIVLIIPEFNLADWRLDAEADAPWLPDGRNRRWLECRSAARSALASGCLDAAQILAREMVELDGGTAASGWTVLADCARGMGNPAAARDYLENARDSQTWNNTPQTPRTLSIVQRALRESALPGRIAVVDLPRYFSDRQLGELPGSHLFLDYCHMTAEGIRLAMAAAASEVAMLLDADRPAPDLERLVESAPRPSARLEAEAHFAAAIHCAHWGQGIPVVSYRCQKAARLSCEVATAMREYLEIQIRRAPTWTCEAVERLSNLATPALRRYVLSFGQAKLFDPILLPTIADALQQNGLPALALLDELRKQERNLSDRPLDLLSPYHRPSWADRDWLGWPTYFWRAYSSTSRYPWVARAPHEVVFELACRRGDTEPGDCQLRINGTSVARFTLSSEWKNFRFSAPADLVQAGVNWLEIDWPQGISKSEEKIERIAADHECGRPTPLLPVFAEIFSLRAVQSASPGDTLSTHEGLNDAPGRR
jgi:hypothetical protein